MITVSKQTENFINCMQAMQDLYSMVYKSLNEIYSTEDTESLMSERFITEFDALEKQIEEFVVMSIKERITDLASSEI